MGRTSLIFLAGASAIALGAGIPADGLLLPTAQAADAVVHGGGHASGGRGSKGGHAETDSAHDHETSDHNVTHGGDHNVTHGSDHDVTHDSDHASGGGEDHAGKGGKGGGGARGGGGKGPGSDAIWRGQGGGADARGKRGAGVDHGGEDDSDRPAWAGSPGRDGKPGRGNSEPGMSKGELYGDLYVVMRNADGTPVVDQNGNVVLIGSDGSLIYKTAEGDIPEDKLDLVQEVEFGRLNVGRSPDQVLEARLAEAIRNLNESEGAITIDATGRLTYLVEGETKRVDSPLENLALYIQLMNNGSLEGLDPAKVSSDLRFLVDGKVSNADVAYGAVLYAAAADKAGTVSVDQVAYLNRIIDVSGTDPLVVGDDTYFNFTKFSYDRADTWSGVAANVLVYDSASENWKPVQLNIYDDLFGGANSTANNAAGFAQAADDALRVIEFVHDFEVPTVPVN